MERTSNMSDQVNQVELRCGECDKRFEKQATLKRHGYYCRSRRLGHRARLRSCIPCAGRKTACDRKQPTCARCAMKDTICAYPVDVPSSRAVKSHRRASLERDSTRPVNQEEIDPQPVQDESSTHDGFTISSSVNYANPELVYLDWDDAEMHLTDLLDLGIQDTTVSAPLAQCPPLNEDRRTDYLSQRTPMLNLPIAKSPSNHNRLLIQRPERKYGMHKIAGLILQTLKSYPVMLEQNTLPPYIHASVLPWHVENTDMEPLTNCFSLMHMISSGVEASWKLFWKNASLECERMLHEYHKMSRGELLAAIQALSIYLLIRLEQGETEHNNIEFLMISAVTVKSACP
nr:hypothetical protein CFP56_20706 [Quercus suber]